MAELTWLSVSLVQALHAEAVRVIEGVDAGEVSESELAAWIEQYTTSR